MFLQTTNTLERMTGSCSKGTAARARLGRVRWVHQHNLVSKFNCLLLGPRKKHSVRPTRQPTIKTPLLFPPALALRHIQVLKHKDGIGFGPCAKLFNGSLHKGMSAIRLPTPQPFENTAHRTGALALCLAGSQSVLHSFSKLPSPLARHFLAKAGSQLPPAKAGGL